MCDATQSLLSEDDVARLRHLLEKHTDNIVPRLYLDIIAAGTAQVYDEGLSNASELKRVAGGMLDLDDWEPMKLHERRIGLEQSGRRQYLSAIESSTLDVVRQVSVRSGVVTYTIASDGAFSEFVGAMRVSLPSGL